MTDTDITDITGKMLLAKLQAEELHPDLAACIEHTLLGPMIKHPLMYDILPVNGWANRRYAQQRRVLAAAEDDEDWHMCVFIHERPYRLLALIDYVLGRDEDEQPIPAVNFGESVRELVADVWCDSENIHENIEEWATIMSGHSPGDPLIFGDQPAFDALPERIELWRGDCDDGGWSWTTQRKTALFFCRRFGQDNDLLHGWVDKRHVFGYLTGRGEAEVMVQREHVTDITAEPYSLELEES